MELGEAYITAEEAEEYSGRVADIAVWAAAGDETRARALLQASDELDTLLFSGVRYGDWQAGAEGVQARAFPRFVPDEPSIWPAGKGVVSGQTWDLDGTTAVVPERVKLAAFLQALSILRDTTRAARLRDQHDGVAGQAAGGVSEQYSGNPPPLVCLEAMRILQPYLLKSGRIV